MKFSDCNKSSNGAIWKILGGVTLAVIAAGVIANLEDIRRYIKITTM